MNLYRAGISHCNNFLLFVVRWSLFLIFLVFNRLAIFNVKIKPKNSIYFFLQLIVELILKIISKLVYKFVLP